MVFLIIQKNKNRQKNIEIIMKNMSLNVYHHHPHHRGKKPENINQRERR